MRIAKTIFGSEGERAAFQAISSVLPAGWSVYPNLPLSQIVRIGKHELTDECWDLYLKTSVDFVVVDSEAHPTLAIEFDGMGGGFSSSTSYFQKRPTRDRNRGSKLQFKLQTCNAVDLPLMVISFDETKPRTADGMLSIVNGIAAQHVATKIYKQTIAEWDAERRGRGKTSNQILRELAELEAETQYAVDPFFQRCGHLYDWAVATRSHLSWQPLFEPDVLTHMREKVPFASVGCRFTLEGKVLPRIISEVAWVRNWAGDELSGILTPDCPVKSGVNPLRVAENIAACLCYEQLLSVLQERGLSDGRMLRMPHTSATCEGTDSRALERHHFKQE